MKKVFKKQIIICLVALLAIAYAGQVISGAKNFSYKERANEAGPDTAVVFYGMYVWNELAHYTQNNPNCKPDRLELVGCRLVSPPVEPGSNYHCEYFKGTANYNRYMAVYDSNIPLNCKGLDIKVPTKPGLYYFGFYSGPVSFEEGKSVRPSEDDYYWFGLRKYDEKKEELLCLKAVKRLYKGTSWEKVIDERIAELSGK